MAGLLIPTDEDAQVRRQILNTLETAIMSSRPRGLRDLGLILFGAFATSSWITTSSIEVLALGKLRSQTFFGMAEEQAIEHGFVKAQPSGITDGNSKVLSLILRNTLIEIHYIQSNQLLDQAMPFLSARSLSMQFDVPFHTPDFISNVHRSILLHTRQTGMRRLKERWELTIGDAEQASFGIAFRTLHVLCLQHNILAKVGFGFLTEEILMTMLHHVFHNKLSDASWLIDLRLNSVTAEQSPNSTMALEDVPAILKAYDILATFFEEYSQFYYARDEVKPLLNPREELGHELRTTTKSPMIVWNLTPPYQNIASRVTDTTLNQIQDKLREVNKSGVFNNSFQNLTEGYNKAVQTFSEIQSKQFVTPACYSHAIKIEYEKPKNNPEIVISVEKACLTLIQSMAKDVKSILPWPGKFVDGRSTNENPKSCYIISFDPGTEDLPKLVASWGDSFMTQLRTDYQEVRMQNEKSWTDQYTSASFDVIETKTADGDCNTELRYLIPDILELPQALDPKSKSQTMGLPNLSRFRTTDQPESTESNDISTSKDKRMRPESDVLNRLIHDPAWDAEDFLVGYEDRHEGIKEIALGSFKRDTQDEEFIPRHRIRYFKRKSDGEIVWDRQRKLDRIFNSC